MACIPPNPRRVEYIDPIHGPLDGPLYMGSHIHQQNLPDTLQTDRQCQQAGKLFLLPQRVIHITFSLRYSNSEH